MPTWKLHLGDTYWSSGFFNVPVDYERYVTNEDGPFEIVLGSETSSVEGRMSRKANTNGTPRIFGNAPLRAFFHRHFSKGNIAEVEFLSPRSIRIRKP